MGESRIARTKEEYEARVRQYKTDPTIEAFRKILFEITCWAKPHIILHSDIEKCVFDTDEQSKAKLKYWKQKMEEYMLFTYSDIISLNGKKIST